MAVYEKIGNIIVAKPDPKQEKFIEEDASASDPQKLFTFHKDHVATPFICIKYPRSEPLLAVIDGRGGTIFGHAIGEIRHNLFSSLLMD